MSLWNRPVDALTFPEIDAFLAQRVKEGPRLDYKADIPKDLAKIVAAFANTTGGLIVLGVAADQKTNEPIWPPPTGTPGLPSAKGLEERIVAICRDNIVPPVLPQVSPVFDNPHLSGNVIVVVRVDASPEAPYAVNDGRHIYERTGSQGTPINFAHIDRIQHLLERRQRLEADREASIARGIDRARQQLGGRRLHYVQPAGMFGPDEEAEHWMRVPLRWASVIPFYAWQDLCTPERCFRRHGSFSRVAQLQRAPGGSYAVMGSHSDPKSARGRSMLTTRGLVFNIEAARESEEDYRHETGDEQRGNTPSDFWVSLDLTSSFLEETLEMAASFYRGDIQAPGYLLVSAGLLDVRHYRMYRAAEYRERGAKDGALRGARFLDDAFRADVTAHTGELLDDQKGVQQRLVDQIAFAFDLPPRPTA